MNTRIWMSRVYLRACKHHTTNMTEHSHGATLLCWTTQQLAGFFFSFCVSDQKTIMTVCVPLKLPCGQPLPQKPNKHHPGSDKITSNYFKLLVWPIINVQNSIWWIKTIRSPPQYYNLYNLLSKTHFCKKNLSRCVISKLIFNICQLTEYLKINSNPVFA